MSNEGAPTWSFRSGTAEETVTLTGSVRTTATEGLREAVFAGLGLCVASEWMFQPDLDNGRVKQILPAWTLPSVDLWAAFPTGRRASAKARAFAAFIEDQLRQTNFAEQPARRASIRETQPAVEFGRGIGAILTAPLPDPPPSGILQRPTEGQSSKRMRSRSPERKSWPGVRVKAAAPIAPSTRPRPSRACRTADNG